MLDLHTCPRLECDVSFNTENLAAVGFVSSSTNALGVLSLTYLFLQSYWNNRRHNLTGRLYYDGSRYGIILEGEKIKIIRIARAIESDGRHKIMQKCVVQDIKQRHYADWQMHFDDATTIVQVLPNYSHAIAEIDGKKADQVIQLMALYRV